MEIWFEVAHRPALFRRDATTGRAELIIDGQTITLASPLNPFTHFRIGTSKKWTRSIDGRSVEIVKDRPMLVGGIRDNTYTIFVDGREVASAKGT